MIQTSGRAASDSENKTVFVYFAHGSLQIPRVARQCMAGLCEGAALAGAQSMIVGPLMRINTSEPEHPPFAELYGVEAPVQYKPVRLPFVHADREGRFSALVRLLVYACHLPALLLRARRSGALTVLSARNASVLLLLAIFKRFFHPRAVVLADVHGPVSSRLMKRVIGIVDGVVAISSHLAEQLRETFDLQNRVSSGHSGVKAQRFLNAVPRTDVWPGRDQQRCLLVYAGKLYYRYEEVAYLLELADQLRDLADILIIGGRPDQIPPWQEEANARDLNNVRFTGFVEPSSIPGYLASADMLVMYYSPSALNPYRSPGKLFEYLAIGKPLLAAQFPSIEEVVRDGENGFLVEPYMPTLLAQRVRELWQTPTKLKTIGEAAQETAKTYTWRRRADAFLQLARDLSSVEKDPTKGT